MLIKKKRKAKTSSNFVVRFITSLLTVKVSYDDLSIIVLNDEYKVFRDSRLFIRN